MKRLPRAERGPNAHLTRCLDSGGTIYIVTITIEKDINAPIADVWRAFNNPDDIVQWDGTDDWRIAWASNEVIVGGKLLLRNEARDGGKGFDYVATYTQIELNRLIEYRQDDGLTGCLEFLETDTGVTFRQTFDANSTQTEDQQRAEWQAVLDRFARHVERQCGAP